jgi:hypothetical protein
MPLSLHAASIPQLVHALKALDGVLDKAEHHANALKLDHDALLKARLYPDMFHLTRQVQIACDMAKAGACRLAGREVPSHPDTEASFADLKARIAKVIDLLAAIPAAEIDGQEARVITIKVAGQEMSFAGADYLVRWVNPNFYFHLTAAYAILRHNGVPLGKGDYLGRS